MSESTGHKANGVSQVTLSVVVVNLGGGRCLLRCLKSLISQTDVTDVEIVVACDDRISDVATLRKKFPSICFLVTEGRRTFAELRAMGVRKAAGTIIALTEDHCIPNPDWCDQILQAQAIPNAAIGGAVEKDVPDTILNWALYLADYVRYMNPVPQGLSPHLTDCNVSYQRKVLEEIANVWLNEFHEPEVHTALKERGGSLWLSPHIIVHQQRSMSLGNAIKDRYIFGRLFGGGRAQGITATLRLVHAAVAILLPPLLTARVANHVFRKRRCVTDFFRALPFLILLNTVWAWGEFVGTVTGRPEPSLTSDRAVG